MPLVIRQAVGPNQPNNPDDVQAVQLALNRWWHFLGKSLPISDHGFTAKLQNRIRQFQSEVVRQSFPTGIILPGDETAVRLGQGVAANTVSRMPLRPPVGMIPSSQRPGQSLSLPARIGFSPLSDEDYANAAKEIGCEALVIEALGLQEGQGHGFDHFNRPVILFEPTHFANLSQPLTRDYRALYPSLTHKAKKPHPYGTFNDQWQHLQQAYLLNPRATLSAVSWGRFQMLGQWPQLGGFATIEQMVAAMCISEQEQLKAFIARVRITGIEDAFKNKRWDVIAASYNGSSYKADHYDTKLKEKYESLISAAN